VKMKITKGLAVAATVGALVSLGLAGCTSSSTDKTTASSSCSGTTSGSASDSIKATGKVGSAPKVTFQKKLSTKTTEKTTLVKGKGALVTKGEPVIFQVSLYNATTGKKATATDYTSSGTYLVAGKSDSLNALSEGLVCSHVGDRIAIAGSAKDSTNGQGISQYKIGKKDSVVFVADILEAFPSKAVGTKEKPVAGQSTVTLAKNGAPTITVSKAAAPTKLQTTTLIKGSGAKIAKGDAIMVEYTGAVYKTGTVFDSSWKTGQPFVATLNTSSIIPGWVDGLAGQTVGSQVMLTIPPAEGYGTKAQTGIPANSTLVFVIDILGKVS
jgi:peptidylprolyl isomerase